MRPYRHHSDTLGCLMPNSLATSPWLTRLAAIADRRAWPSCLPVNIG